MYDSESPYIQITRQIRNILPMVATTFSLNKDNGNFSLPYKYAGARDSKYINTAKDNMGKRVNASYVIFTHIPTTDNQEGIGRDGQFAQLGMVEVQLYAAVGMGPILPNQVLSEIKKRIKELPQVNWTDIDIHTPQPPIMTNTSEKPDLINTFNLSIPYRYDYLLDNIV